MIMSGMFKHRKNEEGVALLLTLLFVVLLTALVVEYVYETQVETAVVTASLNDFEALTAAKAAVNTGMSLLLADMLAQPGQALSGTGSTGLSGDANQAISGGVAYDSLDEPWALGVPFQQINDGVMECTISDEFGKLNLNALFARQTETGDADETLEQTLRYLFEERGAEEGVVDAVLDWLDPDDEPRIDGAEHDYYQSLTVPYGCKNGPLSSVEELLLIRGVTPEIYFGDPTLDQLPLSELLTVNGHRSGRINLNTAPYELLLAFGEAIGMQGLADIATQEREMSPFVSMDDIESRGVVPTITQDVDGNERRTRPFVVKSSAFRIRGNGLAGEGRVRVEAVIWRDLQAGVDGFRVLQWRELR